MTDYREILRLKSLGFSERSIATSCACSRNTVSKALKRAKELEVAWPLPDSQTNDVLSELFYPEASTSSKSRRMPDYAYIRKELLKHGVNKKLLWTEYLEDCRQSGDSPLMYSQFCNYIQQDEQKRRATMHINRKPGEQVEVDWAGDPAHIIDPDTGEITDVSVFVGVMTYSQYAYVEAFTNEKQQAWITAHIHMYEHFGGVARILVSDNCKTAVIHNKGWYNQEVNTVYYEMAEHYNTAIIPARVRRPKDKPNAEGSVSVVSTWIVAALRNEQFFSLAELNQAIHEKLVEYNNRLFQKKEGSRFALFHDEELPLLTPLPSNRYELAEWKTATVQFNYHISFEGNLYSVPFEFIKQKVDVRATEKTLEIFYKHNRIASHRRLYGRKGQYATVVEHMPKEHQEYLEWNGDRFRNWARQIGNSTFRCIDAILTSKRVEQQTYRSCMGLLKLTSKYSTEQLESACDRALSYTATPSYKSIKNLLLSEPTKAIDEAPAAPATNTYGITRGADYYGGKQR